MPKNILDNATPVTMAQLDCGDFVFIPGHEIQVGQECPAEHGGLGGNPNGCEHHDRVGCQVIGVQRTYDMASFPLS